MKARTALALALALTYGLVTLLVKVQQATEIGLVGITE